MIDQLENILIIGSGATATMSALSNIGSYYFAKHVVPYFVEKTNPDLSQKEQLSESILSIKNHANDYGKYFSYDLLYQLGQAHAVDELQKKHNMLYGGKTHEL